MSTQTFGRRVSRQAPVDLPREISLRTASAGAATQPRLEHPTVFADEQASQESPAPAGRPFRVPWRQVSLMATLSFGIGSFVLPDSINEPVEWLLAVGMAVSFYKGFGSRRRRSEPRGPAGVHS